MIYLSWLSCFLLSLAIVISLPSKFKTWSGYKLHQFLRVYRGKPRRPYWKAEDWVWLFLMMGTTGT